MSDELVKIYERQIVAQNDERDMSTERLCCSLISLYFLYDLKILII